MVARKQENFFRTYLDEGRSVSLNLFFILPLLMLYEIGILLSGSEFRNAAEVMLKNLRALMGSSGIRFFHWFLIAIVVLAFIRTFSHERPIFRYFVLMIVESASMAFVLGPILALLVGSILLDFPLTGGMLPDLSVRFLLSIGAGVYEEFLFRFLLLGGLLLIFVRVFRAPFLYGATLAVAISSFLFAAYHHIGPYGLPMETYAFLFRMSAGLVLGTVFIMRGLGVVVYLHVFYDVLRDIELAMR